MKKTLCKQSKDLLGSDRKSEFFALMDSLFPDQDLLNEKSKFRKKAEFTFELMQKLKWTQEEFEKTMFEFSTKWSYNSWMPANILDMKKKLFSENDMVI